MKCPILVMGRMTSNDQTDLSYTDCLEHKCAWWAPVAKCCSVLNAACELWRIGDVLEEMCKNMPIEKQFRL